jgi:endoglucanase
VLNFVDANVTIPLTFIYGDANEDGVVNGKDVILLRKYMANYNYQSGTSTVEVSAGADANGDGTINGKDVILLRKYMANYNYQTGESTVVLGPNT